jgi:hypothetical protein
MEIKQQYIIVLAKLRPDYLEAWRNQAECQNKIQPDCVATQSQNSWIFGFKINEFIMVIKS